MFLSTNFKWNFDGEVYMHIAILLVPASALGQPMFLTKYQNGSSFV